MKSIIISILLVSVITVFSQVPAPSDSFVDISVGETVGAAADSTNNTVGIAESTTVEPDQDVNSDSVSIAVDSTVAESFTTRIVNPGKLISSNGEPIRVLGSFSDTAGIEIGADDTVSYYGETDDSYLLVDDGSFKIDDTVETLAPIPKYLVRVIQYPETLVVDTTSIAAVKSDDSSTLTKAVVPLTFKEKMIAMKDKAVLYATQNKKQVAIGGGAALGLIVLVAVLSGGDDSGGGGGGGGGDVEVPIPHPGSIGTPPD